MKHVKPLSALALAFVLLLFLSAAAGAQTAVTLTGQVTDAQGNPLAGAWVGLRLYTVTDTTTDADGRYAISVPPDNYSLIVTNSPSGNCPSYGAGPYGPWCFRVDGSVLSLTQNMTLDFALPFKRVSVHVVDANGQPVAGAGLGTNNPTSDQFILGGMTFTGNSSYWYDPNAGSGLKTDANGNVTLLLLPVTPASGLEQYYSIMAYPPAATGLPAKSLPSVWVSGDTSFTISYVSSVTLSGRITDPDGNGLPNQTIYLSGPTWQSGSTDGSGHYTFTVSPGYYTMSIGGEVPLDSGLHAPQWYEVQSDPHVIAVTENRMLDFALPFQRVNVHVVDANDQPIAGAAMGAQVRGVDPLSLGGVRFWGVTWHGDPYWSLTTDNFGNATLWLWPASDQPWEGDGYWITALPPADTGMSTVYSPPVYVSGETNVTMRSTEVLPPPQPKAPVISSISPSSAEIKSPDLTLVVDGTDFCAQSIVYWKGTALSTTFVSSTRLTAIVPSSLLTTAETAYVYVVNPVSAGGESNSVPFNINYPSSVTLSGRITDAAGSGLPNQTVNLGGVVSQSDSSGNFTITREPVSDWLTIQGGVPFGSPLRAPEKYSVNTYVDLTYTMTLNVALPFQRVNVHVVDANDQPIAGALLGVWGSVDDFRVGSMTFWGSCSYSYNPSPFPNESEGIQTDANGNGILWLLPADNPGGGYNISATAPYISGMPIANLYNALVIGETNLTMRSTVTLPAKVPVLASLSPFSMGAGDPSFTLVVNGTDFVKTSVVRWNGADRSTTFVSSTQLTATIPSTDVAVPGMANVTVWTPAPGGGESNALPFTINAVFPSATINVYAAIHTTGTGATSGDQKSPLALNLKIFDRATFPSVELKDYAAIWNSGPGLVAPWARITGPTVTTFSNGPANLYTVRVPATGSANNMTSGRYLVVGKVEGAETYVGAATDPLAPNSVTDKYLQVVQKSDGEIVPAVATSGTATPAAKATPTPKPSTTPKVVPTNKAPKPTATPKPTVTPKKLSPATPAAVTNQTPVPPATATPKKALTAMPMATWTLPPTKTSYPTATPRDKPTKH